MLNHNNKNLVSQLIQIIFWMMAVVILTTTGALSAQQDNTPEVPTPDDNPPTPQRQQLPIIHLKSREIQPSPFAAFDLSHLVRADKERIHILVQLDFIPRELAKDALQDQGLKLLAYVPDYAWIASVSAVNPDAALALPGVTWVGELSVDDKLDPAIEANQWGPWNLAPDGTAAIYVAMHKDESLETGRRLAEAHGAKVIGEVIGINLLVVEIPQNNIQALAAEDAVQWIEPAAPPLDEANDGIRDQIGVNAVNAAPYNLDGSGIDVLVYDSGQVGNHSDFGTRLTNGDADTFSDHSTHVAGIVGGSGANSAAQGGSVLQWRGMAPNVDLISYGTQGYGAGDILFYNNVPDIEADFAAAQNYFGADLANGSLSSNIYDNDPEDCWVMGKYGSASVLLDQIIRGGNPVVGVGDKYITAWAAGNERNNAGSCSNTYNSTTPPAAAKNPIHVGASNTNNNSMTSFSSWGPTEDGRIKPIVTAGGCQSSGDFGITSTDNNPVDDYTVMCGTSMATPAVAGGLALMLQHYRAVYGTSGNFWPATGKAILIQTAVDLGNPGPDYQWGFGQVDIQAAVDLISRKAFRQENIAEDEVDLYYFIVGEDSGQAKVTLVWDDFEATQNANPTLINNLDLELVSPSGVVLRPWVLNPASPASNATRGVDNRNNQELVEVPSPEVGTWMVRVSGTTVPQGPQDYSLVCEGCQPLDVGACQAEVDGTATASLSGESETLGQEDGGLTASAAAETPAPLTAGEIWQQSLEIPIDDEDTYLHTSLALVADAREVGPEAMMALAATLRGPALDLVMDEITTAQAILFEAAPQQPDIEPVSIVEESNALTLQQTAEAANRARALTSFQDPEEGYTGMPITTQQLLLPAAPAADLTVGNSCTYPTIAAAITAANPNDRLLIEGGVTFTENLIMDKNLTLLGGYNGCASGSTARTVINGNASGRVIDIAAGINATLQNLNITNGSTGAEGGGIRFAIGAGVGTLTLTNVDVYANSGYWGGGIWLGPDTDLVASNVDIYNNVATLYGGGLRLFGGRATLNDSNIYNNSAPIGGGVYGTQETGFSAELNLPSSADIYDNQALTGGALGGGVYLREGAMTLADCSDIYSNDAMDGGGAYVITSTITINGSCSEIQYNTATGNGGGVYAQGSTVNLDDDAELYDNDAGTDTTGSGGGAYLDNSNLYSDKASIRYNHTDDYGAGIYATNGSIVDMDLGSYTCVGERCSRLYGNIAANNYGGGIYANDSAVWLDNIFIENNGASLGGAIYATNSSLYIDNSLFARNNATSTTADAIRLYTSATMVGRGNTFAYNDSGGVSTGQAIDAFNADLTLQCSIIWGHSSSISPTGLDVSYSDIQGSYAGVGNLDVNPLFVSSGGQDYHLQSSSPVIDHCPCFSGLATDFDNEVRPIVRVTAATPYDMGADEVTQDRVGVNGACTYGTIQQAVNAASNGDTIQISAGVYFETVDITNKNIDLVGGYDSTCTSIAGDPTRLEGSTSAGSTLDIFGSTVTLQNLEIAWGSSVGGGVDARSGAQVTLDNTDVFNNHGSSGGGIYVSSNSIVTTINNSEVHNNTASTIGGGVGVWGQFSGNGNYSDIYENCAPHGGGFYVPGGSLYINSADTYLNQAADANGLGGGIYLTNSGVVTLTNGAYVYYLNQAYNGAGIYADNAQVYLNGGATTLRDNVAANDGGAVYLANGSTLQSSGARIGQAGSSLANESQNGAGIYALNSTVDFDGGYIINNIAAGNGGGIFADNSTISLTGVQVGDTAAYYANQLGSSGHYGAGLYLTGATQATLDNTVVAGNMFQTTGFTYGGGAYVSSSSVLWLTNNSRIQEHTAPSVSDGRGAGIYINNGTVTIDNSQVISNTAGAVGGGIRMLGTSTLNATNGSVIGNNTSSNGEGGGIAATGTANITLSDSSLEGNQADGLGGAVYLGGGMLSADNCTLDNNSATQNGGAIYNNDASLQIDQTYLRGNGAVLGGAIFQTGAGASGDMTNSLLHDNSASGATGAGVQVNGGSFTATHVTLAGNAGPGYSVGGAATNHIYNSIAWGNSNGGFVGSFGSSSCNIDQSGMVGTSTNPLFVNAAADNYHLQGVSTAVNACPTGSTVDLENLTRPKGSGYDMGAYEFTRQEVYLPAILK